MTESESVCWRSAFAAREFAGPTAQRIHDTVCMLVRDGKLSPATRLPSGRWMAEHFAVGRVAVAEALDLLVQRGVVERVGRAEHRVARLADGSPEGGFSSDTGALIPASIALDGRRFGARLEPVQTLDDAFREAALDQEALHGEQTACGDLQALLWQIRLRLLPTRRLQAATEDIVPVRSAREALALSLKALLKPGQAVLFDDLHRYAVESSLLGSSVRQYTGATDAGGLTLEGMPKCDLIVLAPARQGPYMAQMEMTRRSHLMQMARENDIRIVEVDYEVDHLDGGGALPLKAQDQDGRVLFIGIPASAHFGLGRQAYICAPNPLVNAVRAARRASGGYPDRMAQAVQARYLERGSHAAFLQAFRNAVARLGQHLLTEIEARHPLLRLESIGGNGYACIHAPPIIGTGPIRSLANATGVAIVQAHGDRQAGTRYWVDMCASDTLVGA